jgi:carbonic anhydrase/acetyltransferase-like protein (isoleucine patch superfamily)
MQAISDYWIAADAIVLGDIVLASGVNIWYGCVLRGDLARITLGRNANIQDGTIIHTDHDAPQTIGEDVVIGHRAVLHGNSIGRGSLIGMGAILLSGSEIGEECLIAAGTLIAEGKKIPPRSVVMGMPGKIVREVTQEDLVRIRAGSAHYRLMAQRHAAGEFARIGKPNSHSKGSTHE